MKNLLLTAMAFVAFNVNAQNISIKAIPQNPLCHGAATGSIDLVIDGGQSPFTFLWSTGETTSSISNLVAGTYSVTVNDNGGLISTSSIKISEPDQLASSAFVVNVSSAGGNDGSINLNVRGGTHDYSFAWSNGATSKDIGNLTAGTYSVTITDGFGCQFSLTRTVIEMGQLPAGGINYNNHLTQGGNNDGRSLINNENGGTANMNISLYPNPASDFLSVRMKSTGDSQVTVFNNNGQAVLAQKFYTQNPMVDVSNLPNGNYVVQVKTAAETVNKNVAIVK